MENSWDMVNIYLYVRTHYSEPTERTSGWLPGSNSSGDIYSYTSINMSIINHRKVMGNMMKHSSSVVAADTLQKPCTFVWGDEHCPVTHFLRAILDFLMSVRNFTGCVAYNWRDYKRWIAKDVEGRRRSYFKALPTVLFEVLGTPSLNIWEETRSRGTGILTRANIATSGIILRHRCGTEWPHNPDTQTFTRRVTKNLSWTF
jgi:hypothetical protein